MSNGKKARIQSPDNSKPLPGYRYPSKEETRRHNLPKKFIDLLGSSD
jgi:hypothetical protein